MCLIFLAEFEFFQAPLSVLVSGKLLNRLLKLCALFFVRVRTQLLNSVADMPCGYVIIPECN